jgi:RimJ/RimL family protein N-acetyltransferase
VIHFERSFDYGLIREILTHPQVYPHISDDGSPAPAEFQPLQSEAVWYIVVRDEDEVLGLWMLHPHNSICWECHTCFLPHAWGSRACVAGRLLSQWVWEHIPCRRIIGNVPACNRLALAYMKRIGFEEFGVNRASFLNNGRIYDQICLGISPPSRPEAPGLIEEEEMVCLGQP